MAKQRRVFVCLTIDRIPHVPSDMVKCRGCGARLWRTRAVGSGGEAICFPCCFAEIRRGEVSAARFGVTPVVLREICRETGLDPREVRDLAALMGKAMERYARSAH